MQSLRISTLEYYDDRAVSVLLASVLVAIGLPRARLGADLPVGRGRARGGRSSRACSSTCRWSARVLQALSTRALRVRRPTRRSSNFLDGPRTVDAAIDITRQRARRVRVGARAAGRARRSRWRSCSSRSTRCGSGCSRASWACSGSSPASLQILPFGGPLPVVQCFWLLMLGAPVLGPLAGRRRRPRGGRATPSRGRRRREIREQRAKAAAERRGETYEPPPAAGGARAGHRRPVAVAPRRASASASGAMPRLSYARTGSSSSSSPSPSPSGAWSASSSASGARRGAPVEQRDERHRRERERHADARQAA